MTSELGISTLLSKKINVPDEGENADYSHAPQQENIRMPGRCRVNHAHQNHNTVVHQQTKYYFQDENIVVVSPVVGEADGESIPLHRYATGVNHHHGLLLDTDMLDIFKLVNFSREHSPSCRRPRDFVR